MIDFLIDLFSWIISPSSNIDSDEMPKNSYGYHLEAVAVDDFFFHLAVDKSVYLISYSLSFVIVCLWIIHGDNFTGWTI